MISAKNFGFLNDQLYLYYYLMYIYSQNKLRAAKTASYFSYAPYIGIFASIIILKELPNFHFLIAFIIMLFAGCLIYKDNKND